jgi:predicted tellurium resistance membrane protein TerC
MKHLIKRTRLLLFTALTFLCTNISLLANNDNQQFKKINKEVAKATKKAKKNLKQTTPPNWKKWKSSNSQKHFH